MTRLEKALQLIRDEMAQVGRPWVLVYLKTHQDAQDVNVGVMQGGNVVFAVGLLEIARDIIKYDHVLGDEDGEKNDLV